MEKEKAVLNFVNSESEELFLLKEHALIGISPFNSYYSEENLKKLFSWGLSTFKRISIFIPDGISLYTLRAMGYSEEKARKKTHSQDRYLRNKAIKALLKNGLSEKEAKDRIIFYSDLINNERYAKFHDIYNNLYESDEDFREGCLTVSKKTLGYAQNFANIDRESLHIAVKYFLDELPVLLNGVEILNLKSALFVYKDVIEFIGRVYNDTLFSHLPSPFQGYVGVNFIE
jgi:cyclo(L-tyrosyl-L-tyrosyl) synthase